MTRRTYMIAGAVLASIIIAFSAGAGLMSRGPKRPAASEFGTTRTSAQKLYVATLHGTDSLKPRKMYTLEVAITDAAGAAVSNANITIDGGMPQHGHGLPTRPRITRAIGNGTYEIGGVRFNMGGWWELKLTIDSPSGGTDTVTFNLSL